MLIVHLRKQKQRLTEMQIVALTARPEAEKAIKALLDVYRRQLFPGVEKEKDTSMESAKLALAEEAKKVYMVRKLDSIPDLKSSIQRATEAGSTELAKAAIKELQKKEMENLRIKSRLASMKERKA